MIAARHGLEVPPFLVDNIGKTISIFHNPEDVWVPNVKAYLMLYRAALLHEMECVNTIHDRAFSTNGERDVKITRAQMGLTVEVVVNSGGYGMDHLIVMPTIGSRVAGFLASNPTIDPSHAWEGIVQEVKEDDVSFKFNCQPANLPDRFDEGDDRMTITLGLISDQLARHYHALEVVTNETLGFEPLGWLSFQKVFLGFPGNEQAPLSTIWRNQWGDQATFPPDIDILRNTLSSEQRHFFDAVISNNIYKGLVILRGSARIGKSV